MSNDQSTDEKIKDLARARVVPPIEAARVEQAEFRTARWRVLLPPGTLPNDILGVSFWSHVAKQLEPLSELIVATEDLTWQAEVVVVDKGSNWARVVFKTTEDGKRLITRLGGLQASKVVFLPGHTVAYGGMIAKWRVVRDADAAVLRDKFATEGDAYSWLADYAKSIAA